MSKRKSTSSPDHKLKRANTMEATEKSGLDFVGEKVDFKQHVETRAQKEARETVSGLLRTSVHHKKEYNAEKLKMVFRLFDHDRDGHITKEEVAEMLKSLGKRPLKRKIDHIMQELDTDNNGTIEQNEWVEWFLKKNGRGTASSTTTSSSTASTPAASSSTSTSVSSSTATSTPPPPSRSAPRRTSSSISDFYTEHAGLHETAAAAPDTYSNPSGREFDLGREGAFDRFTIGILNTNPISGFNLCLNALKAKGFKIDNQTTEAAFLSKINDYDEIWVISSSVAPSAGLVPAIKAHHEAGKGLIVWADNTPYITQANAILSELIEMKLEGSNTGGKQLVVGDGAKKGEFSRGHILLTGIVNIYEGITICYPSSNHKSATKPWNLLATSTDDKPCMMTVEPKTTDTWGRIVIDCGFTKLYDNYWKSTAGTERYVLNAAVWALNLEKSVHSINAPVQANDYREMAQGEFYELEGEVGKIMMGLGWNSGFDLDASVVLFDKAQKHVETISYMHLKSNKFKIKHSGDILNGATNRKLGDDEQIDVDLTSLTSDVDSLLFVVTIFTSGKTFKEVTDAYARLVDKTTNIEKVRFTLTELGTQTALVMCKVYRTEAGTWRMLTIGEPTTGKTAAELLSSKALDKYVDPNFTSEKAVDSRLT